MNTAVLGSKTTVIKLMVPVSCFAIPHCEAIHTCINLTEIIFSFPWSHQFKHYQIFYGLHNLSGCQAVLKQIIFNKLEIELVLYLMLITGKIIS